MFVASVRVRRC